MIDNENLSSDFTPVFNSLEAGSVIDFSRAKRLNTTGSTCDAYVTELKHRKVFVKRLKEKYRGSARYRAAFEKEYEVGVGLSHPALPVYIDFHGDYIVMNYIDGRTLAEMLDSDDDWLSKSKNAIKILDELLDVLEYLHRKGVIHCDIKADNILLTYTDNNVALIDLDKVYTSHLADTPGSATKYGLDETDKRNTDIDFVGLGRIAGKLADKVKSAEVKKTILRFSAECQKPGATADELRVLLEGRRNYNRVIFLIIGCLVIFFAVFFLKLQRHNSESEASEEIGSTTTGYSNQDNNVSEPKVESTVVNPSANQTVPSTQPTHSAEELDRMLTEHFKPLLEIVDNTMQQYDNGQLDASQQREAVYTITDRYLDLISESYALCQALYPDITPTQAQLKVADSPVFSSVTKRVTEATNLLSSISQE